MAGEKLTEQQLLDLEIESAWEAYFDQYGKDLKDASPNLIEIMAASFKAGYATGSYTQIRNHNAAFTKGELM